MTIQRNDVTAAESRLDGQWLALVVAWVIVGVPTLWGVAQTVMKSLALFK